MGTDRPREPRTIRRASDGYNKADALNNAFDLLREMTSARRLSTLVRRPTRSEVLAALDDWIAYDVLENSRERAREFRDASLTWRDGEEIPQAVYEAARRFCLSLGDSEPPCGWENDDGYQVRAIDRDMDDADLPPPPEAAGAPRSYSDASKKAALLAQAVATAVNRAGALASPRSWAKAMSWPSREHLVEHVDQLLSAFGTELEAQRFAAPARRLGALLSAWEPGPEVPADISEAAREFLSALGIDEPPGGWDAPKGPPDGSSSHGG
ncbi:uncharacterized protein SOCE26_072600 [Sorangium cellulosum]|uniref:Uncharacterized protein n=1 Tax=Sorangium cellulosum TaxID=56 RepID=A0A2L0F2G7_SORCE|nr:hypothetical protein [Sorangium cellulosum]AUX45764.1 uncharacterized protein SOCE26_072600 [Sorangium cellulosum]